MDRALRKFLETLEISTDYYEYQKLFSRFSNVTKKIIAQETDPAELLKKYINNTKLFSIVFKQLKIPPTILPSTSKKL